MKVKIKNFFNRKWLIIAVIFTAIVLVLTHLPQEVMQTRLPVRGLDKLAHALAYGAITILFVVSLRACPSLLSASFLFFAILAIGTLDELTQSFVGRTASLADWLANIVGIVTVLLFSLRFKRPRYQSSLTAQHLLFYMFCCFSLPCRTQ